MKILFHDNFEYDMYFAMSAFLPGFQKCDHTSPNHVHAFITNPATVDQVRCDICHNLGLLDSSSFTVKEEIIRHIFKSGITDENTRRCFEPTIQWVLKQSEDSKERLEYMGMVAAAVEMARELVSNPRVKSRGDTLYRIDRMSRVLSHLMVDYHTDQLLQHRSKNHKKKSI